MTVLGVNPGIFTALPIERRNASSPDRTTSRGLHETETWKDCNDRTIGPAGRRGIGRRRHACRPTAPHGRSNRQRLRRSPHRLRPPPRSSTRRPSSASTRWARTCARSKTFTVNAEVTVEEVLDSGQKVENANTVEIAARRPDMLRVYTTSAERSRKIYFDGKTFTLNAQKLGYYGAFPRPRRSARNLEVPRSLISSCRSSTCFLRAPTSRHRPDHVGHDIGPS